MKDKKSAEASRAHVFYEGRVQGVGFRYTAERLALELKLVGWIKNLPDGRVEILCEGPKEKVEKFLHRIKESGLGSYIRRENCSWEAATHEFKDFTVEFAY